MTRIKLFPNKVLITKGCFTLLNFLWDKIKKLIRVWLQSNMVEISKFLNIQPVHLNCHFEMKDTIS